MAPARILDPVDVITQLRADLCEESIQHPVPSWGPVPKDGAPEFVYSWTDTISVDVGDTRHYLTCQGSHNGTSCMGRWNRRQRAHLSPGLYCIFGGWVNYNGNTISLAPSSEERSLKRLRGLWAKHILQHQTEQDIVDEEPTKTTSNQGGVEAIQVMLQKAISKRRSGHKVLGQGSGGWDGMAASGIVMKRDTGNDVIGNFKDNCSKEPGGYYGPGDLEIWATWHGWSALCSRDGRWRPGTHLEMLAANVLTIIDYGSTREVWRTQDVPWIVATDWVIRTMPNDIPQSFVKGVQADLKEMIRTEKKRLQDTAPNVYKPEESHSRDLQYRLLLDRGGNVGPFHTFGTSIKGDRGYVAFWTMSVLNDILDYERDVLGGETNNLARGFTSDQQVVDAAYATLLVIEGFVEVGDFDVVDTLLAGLAAYLLYWRYNSPKFFVYYEARSIRHHGFTQPPEVREVVDILQNNYGVDGTLTDSYGTVYDRVNSRLQGLYDGCTCDSKPSGHDLWSLMSQTMDNGLNEKLEEQMLLTWVDLCMEANSGNFNCECASDLVAYEGFKRFMDPDTGLVARMHYRTSTAHANTLTE